MNTLNVVTREAQMKKKEIIKICWVVMETLTGSPGRPLGPTSPSSPWKHTRRNNR